MNRKQKKDIAGLIIILSLGLPMLAVMVFATAWSAAGCANPSIVCTLPF